MILTTTSLKPSCTFCTLSLLLLLNAVILGQPVQDLKICPEQITTNIYLNGKENGFSCQSPYNEIYSIIESGTTMYLDKQTISDVGEDGFYCTCDYYIKKEDIGSYLCRDDSEWTGLSGNANFDLVFTIRWLDQDAPPEDCKSFEINNPPGVFEDSSIYKVGDVTKALSFETKKYIWPRHVPWTAEHMFDQAQPAWELLKSRSLDRGCGGLKKPIVTVLDANPEYVDQGFFGGEVSNIQEIEDATQLFKAVRTSRSAVTADGVSEMLIRMRFDEIVNARLNLSEKYGTVEYPWASQSYEIDGSHYVFALYRPPVDFPTEEEPITWNEIDAIDIPIKLKVTTSEDRQDFDFNLKLVRPPVVLVHGTFDDPDNCWRTSIAKPDFQSMTQRLEDEGFKVFTVDYRNTNGRYEFNSGPGFLSDEFLSGFERNKKVVFENPGGISDALEYYRDTLDAAVTKVDAIGHSLGGVLIRVYASDQEGEGGYDTDYFRDNNFQEGDINRIITLSSTHHGSDMAAFHDFLEGNQSNTDAPFLEQFTNNITTQVTYFAGIGTAQIVADQRPSSPALKKIGATPIPAHSIVATVKDMNDITQNVAEENSAQGYSLFWKFLTTMLYFNQNTMDKYLLDLIEKHYKRSSLKNTKVYPEPKFNSVESSVVREARKPSNRREFFDQFHFNLSRLWFVWHLFNEEVDDDWIETHTAFATQYETTEINYGDFNDNLQVEIREGQWDLIRDEIPQTFIIENKESYTNEVIDFFRYLIFKNADNDCTVSYDSQTGKLKEPYITHFNEHLHSFVPRYTDVQDRVVELLESGNQYFDQDGYPEAGQLMPIEFPNPTELNVSNSLVFNDNPEQTDCDAICWAGYVPSHARAFAKVADKKDIVILGRPVNPDATAVIKANNATKPMNLKGKSSNWGPMRALIAEDQRFSKIWFQYEVDRTEKRDAEIAKYNGEVVKSLNDPANIAVLRHLEKKYDCEGVEQSYAVYFDTTMEDALTSIVLTADNRNFYRWVKENDDPCDNKDKCCPLDLDNPVPNVNLKELNVLANPQKVIDFRPLFYTADYDLLAIGFHEQTLDGNEKDPYNRDKNLVPDFTSADFDREKGFITQSQKDLLNDLNDAVEKTGHEGGKVTHHGPENQYYIAGNPNKGSPYVDYPIIVFEPDDSRTSSKGRIRAIPKGPPGFRDIYLKQYMAKMRRKGYNLYPNQVAVGWQWDHYHTYSFHKPWDDRDAPDLDSGPEEIPFPKECDCEVAQIREVDQVRPDFEIMATEITENLYPNPTLSVLNIEFYNTRNQNLEIFISDITGTIIQEDHLEAPKGLARKMINLSDVPAGFYVLTLRFQDGQIITKKFIKEKSN